LAAALGADPTNVSRELARLEREGFLRASQEGRQLYYAINRDYPFLKPALALLQGSVGVEPTLKSMLKRVPGVESAWLYGSFAKGEADSASDIDLLIVGRPEPAQLAAEVRKAETSLGREINYTELASRELKRRLRAQDAFLTDIWNGKRLELIADGHQTTAGESKTGESVSRRRAKKSGVSAQDPEH